LNLPERFPEQKQYTAKGTGPFTRRLPFTNGRIPAGGAFAGAPVFLFMAREKIEPDQPGKSANPQIHDCPSSPESPENNRPVQGPGFF
jgi:hypothetical protein